MAPKYQSLPKFSDDPEQNAEMTAEYLWDCRMQGVDPYYAGDTDDDLYEEEDYLGGFPPDDDDEATSDWDDNGNFVGTPRNENGWTP